MQTFDHGESCSGAHTLENPFPIALESPFSLICYAVIAASTALWRNRDKTYLLFLIGFVSLYVRDAELSIKFNKLIEKTLLW